MTRGKNSHRVFSSWNQPKQKNLQFTGLCIYFLVSVRTVAKERQYKAYVWFSKFSKTWSLVHTHQDSFESATFSFLIRLPVILAANPDDFPRMEKKNRNESDKTCWRSKIVSSSLPTNMAAQRVGLVRKPSDVSGQSNSMWIRYVWTGKFLNPERKSCGFKNIWRRVDGA